MEIPREPLWPQTSLVFGGHYFVFHFNRCPSGLTPGSPRAVCQVTGLLFLENVIDYGTSNTKHPGSFRDVGIGLQVFQDSPAGCPCIKST
jgi:hypothetical protein